MRNYVYEYDGFGGAFELLEAVMDAMEPVQKVPKAIIAGSFPPTNLLREADGTLLYEFAVAGYKKEEIDLEFKDDQLILTLNPEERKVEEGVKLIQKGIRSTKSRQVAYVPSTKYAVSKASSSLADGILSVRIPINEESKPIKVRIQTS